MNQINSTTKYIWYTLKLIYEDTIEIKRVRMNTSVKEFDEFDAPDIYEGNIKKFLIRKIKHLKTLRKNFKNNFTRIILGFINCCWISKETIVSKLDDSSSRDLAGVLEKL